MAGEPRKPNPFYLTAVLITDRLCPDGVAHPKERADMLTKTLAGLSRLCGLSAKQHGWPVYDLTLVYLSWMALCDRAICEDWGNLPSIEKIRKSYSKDGKPWIEAWPKMVLSNVPPVWDSQLHDDYVRQNAPMLRLVGFQYKGKRLLDSELEELGLLPKGE